jgi:phosphate transport system protein
MLGSFMTRAHTDREYDNQLRQVRDKLLLMAGHVEAMIANSVRALVERDVLLARRTIDNDHKVNQFEVETDELCLVILAKRQPMASDLRFITLALKMVTDLERIGDLAVNICERAIELASAPAVRDHDDILRTAELVQSMVRDAIDAFIHADDEKAQRVIDRDSEVDELYHQTFRALLTHMMEDSTMIQPGIHLQSVAKWLERMADHSTNIAEQVVFMVKGKDIRHVGHLSAPPPRY